MFSIHPQINLIDKHVENSSELLNRYKMNRTEINYLEDKMKNSKFLNWLNSIENDEIIIELDDDYIVRKTKKYENILHKVSELTQENNIILNSIRDEMFCIKVKKLKIDRVEKEKIKLEDENKSNDYNLISISQRSTLNSNKGHHYNKDDSSSHLISDRIKKLFILENSIEKELKNIETNIRERTFSDIYKIAVSPNQMIKYLGLKYFNIKNKTTENY